MSKDNSVDNYFNKRIVLHVGLPKAATAFMRRAVYPRLDSTKVFHSQTYFKNEINVLIEGEYKGVDVEKFRENFKRKSEKISQDTILLCEFSLSGNPVIPGNDYESFYERTDFLKKAFPSANIIIILRNQIDWLVSIYRNIIESGETLSMDEFLNFNGGKFIRRSCVRQYYVDALCFDFSSMCDYYVKLFGRENVHVFFQEDLKNDPENFIKDLQKVIGCGLEDSIRIQRVNRGSSALALTLTRLKNRMGGPQSHEKAPLQKFFLSDPIQKLQKYDIPNRPFLDVIKKIESRYILAVLLRRVLIKVSIFFSWHQFVQHFINKIIYIDWDILGDEKRSKLIKHYARVNKGLLPYFNSDNIRNYYLYKSE